jgi:hypothetical protein
MKLIKGFFFFLVCMVILGVGYLIPRKRSRRGRWV